MATDNAADQAAQSEPIRDSIVPKVDPKGPSNTVVGSLLQEVLADMKRDQNKRHKSSGLNSAAAADILADIEEQALAAVIGDSDKERASVFSAEKRRETSGELTPAVAARVMDAIEDKVATYVQKEGTITADQLRFSLMHSAGFGFPKDAVNRHKSSGLNSVDAARILEEMQVL